MRPSAFCKPFPELARFSAHSDTFVLLATFSFLDLDFQNAFLRSCRCGGWAVSLH